VPTDGFIAPHSAGRQGKSFGQSPAARACVAGAKAQNRPINGAVSTRGASVDITMQAFMKVAGLNGTTIPNFTRS
jgi:hypothetical protein